MKPYINNIPEEIYLQIVGDYDGECDFDFEDLQESEITWSQEQIFKNDYKYVLEDRLKNRIIDKACEWLKSHIDEGLVIYHNNTWCSLGEFIEKFSKAMKGV